MMNTGDLNIGHKIFISVISQALQVATAGDIQDITDILGGNFPGTLRGHNSKSKILTKNYGILSNFPGISS